MHLDEEEKKGKQENLASGEAGIYRRDQSCTGHSTDCRPTLDESAGLETSFTNDGSLVSTCNS